MREESDTRGHALSQGQVSAKHYYRFKYLRSEHWANLRLSKLSTEDAKCKKCGFRDPSNDVHHLRYRKLYDVELDDLVVLCRGCHELAHEAMELCREFIDIWTSRNPYNAWNATARMMRILMMIRKRYLPEKLILRYIENPHFTAALGRFCKRIDRIGKKNAGTFEEALREATIASIECQEKVERKKEIAEKGLL